MRLIPVYFTNNVDAISTMVTRDRRNARFPVFVNPVGYPNVPQQRQDPY